MKSNSLKVITKEIAAGFVRAGLYGSERTIGRPEKVSVSCMQFGRVLAKELKGLCKVVWKRRKERVYNVNGMVGGKVALSESQFVTVEKAFEEIVGGKKDVLGVCDNEDCRLADVVVRRRSLQQCSGCRAVSYCSKECQRVDWRKGHRDHCPDLNGEVVFEQ